MNGDIFSWSNCSTFLKLKTKSEEVYQSCDAALHAAQTGFLCNLETKQQINENTIKLPCQNKKCKNS